MGEKLYCLRCGKALTDENTHPAQTMTGISSHCMDCEALAFENFAAQNGLHFALFLSCARFDVPCEPTLVPKTFEDPQKNTREKWKEYIANLLASPKYGVQQRSFEFDSGINRFLRIFGKELSQKDFAAYMLAEQQIVSSKPGTQAQRDKWGEQKLWSDMPVDKEIYDDLDRRYSSRIQSYAGQTISPQMEDVLIKACRWDAVIDHLLAKGESRQAKEVQAMLDSMLASEQMRKKDEKPTAGFQLDAWIVAMERSGYMVDKDFSSKEKVIDSMLRALTRKGKYHQTLDVAHQVEMNIINHLRRNNDEPTEQGLPEDLVVTDEFGECDGDPEEYEKALKDAKLSKLKVPTKKKGKSSADR